MSLQTIDEGEERIMEQENSLQAIQFEGYEIRRIWDAEVERWQFAVVDVIGALSESSDPNKYWYDMKRREQGVELSAICRKFKMKAANGRFPQFLIHKGKYGINGRLATRRKRWI